ncbi:MAG: PUA domain-containing protein [Conexivisphaerales archaeon]
MQIEKEIFATSLEYFYGKGILSNFPWNELSYKKSRASNRVKSVLRNGKVFATIKENGIITLSIDCAKYMLESGNFLNSCVTASEEAEEFIVKGGNLFCKHVCSVGDNVKPGLDVGIINTKHQLIAVGKAIIPKSYMLSFKRGIAVKVRKGTSHETQ